MKQVRQRWPHGSYATLTRVWTAAHRQMLGHELVHQRLVKAAEQNAPLGYPAGKMFDAVEISPNSQRTILVLLQIANIGVGTLAQNT
jgi:hypothetical protein